MLSPNRYHVRFLDPSLRKERVSYLSWYVVRAVVRDRSMQWRSEPFGEHRENGILR